MRRFALAAATLLILYGATAAPRAGSLELAMGPTSAPHKPGGNPNAAASSSESGQGSAGMNHKKTKRRKSSRD